jgi:hypothetical protein
LVLQHDVGPPTSSASMNIFTSFILLFLYSIERYAKSALSRVLLLLLLEYEFRMVRCRRDARIQ